MTGTPRTTTAGPGLPVAALTAVVMVVTGLIAMSEAGRLITGVLDPAAHSRSLAEVTGPLALGETDAWAVWAQAELRRPVASWIAASATVDLLFIAGYRRLVGQLVARTRFPRRTLAALVGTDLLETGLLLVTAGLLGAWGRPGWLPPVLAVVSTAKWVLVAVLVAAVLRKDVLRSRLWVLAVRITRAARVQRLSLLVVAVLAALALVPSPGVFDQFPDVLRGWFQTVAYAGVRHGLLAVAAAVLVSAQLFAIGRRRSERVWSTWVGSGPPDTPAAWTWWVGGSAVAVLLAGSLAAGSGGRLVHWPTVGWVVGVPVVVLLASLLAQCHCGPRLWQERRPPRGPAGRRRALDVWVAGDVLALALLLVGALALVRALTAPVLLGWGESRVSTWVVRLVVSAGAAGLALALPRLADRGLRWLDDAARPVDGTRPGQVVHFLRPSLPGGMSPPLRRAGIAVLWGSGVVGLLALMAFPVQIGRFLGVAATALLALGAWAFVLGLVIVHMQHRQPMAVFRLMKLRANPVLTLLLLTALLASLRGGDPRLHQLRTPPGEAAAVAPRSPLPTALAEWARGRAQACAVPTAGGDVLPMVLVAASGGGIRAAYWTAGILDELTSAGPCAGSAVLLSSGVSGGSVGLALARGGTPIAQVRALTAPDALAAAVAGTLVGDLIAGVSGLRLPSRVAGEWAWRDRAGLMEEVWEESAPVLRERWGPGDTGTSGVLLLNSTAAGLDCRVLVGQVVVDGAPVPDGAPPEDTTSGPVDPECAAGSEQAPASLDLQQTLRGCTPDMSWATAAMLSARFPTVTPAARVPSPERRTPGVDCAPAEDMQLIDGGYAEGSGLGTLADVSTELMQAVRDHNARRAPGDPAVVPVVLHLEDEPRTEIVREPAELAPELFVPLVGRGAAALQTSTGTWLQRLAEAVAEPCPAADSTCAAVAADVQGRLTGGIVVAAPLTEPSVEAPLGWTLSRDSRIRLDDQRDRQQDGCTGDPHPGGYVCLEALLAVLEPTARER